MPRGLLEAASDGLPRLQGFNPLIGGACRAATLSFLFSPRFLKRFNPLIGGACRAADENQ